MKFLNCLLIISLLCIHGYGYAQENTATDIANDPDNVVYIPDPNLRNALAKILVKAIDAPITVKEMESFTHLNVSKPEFPNLESIKDLTGLEYAINVQELWFEHHEVSDLSPLAGLTEIRELRFVKNNVSDLSPIAGLTKIHTLVLEHNPISDLSPLAGLSELAYIQFSHNFLVKDISVLADKEKLTHILMWGPPITDMSPLAELPNIERIDLCGNEISEIPSLENAPNLKELYLVDNDISDVSVLQNLTGLERLNLTNNNITDISPLANLTNLKWLAIGENPITDWSPLNELAKRTKIEPSGFIFTANADRVGIDNPFTFEVNAQFIRNLVGWECNITFDAELLEAVEVTEGDFLSQDATATLFQEGTIDNEIGVISGYKVLRLDGTGVNGSGTLLSIKFRAKEIGTAVFTPGNCHLGNSDGEEIPSEMQRLEIRIEAHAPLPEDEVSTGPKWDINRDGVINILDMILVSKNIGTPVNEAPHSDVNGDGVINILDLVQIANASEE